MFLQMALLPHTPLPYTHERSTSVNDFAPPSPASRRNTASPTPLLASHRGEGYEKCELGEEHVSDKWQAGPLKRAWRLSMCPIICAVLALIGFGIGYGILKINHSQVRTEAAAESSSQAVISASFQSSLNSAESLSQSVYRASQSSAESVSSVSGRILIVLG